MQALRADHEDRFFPLCSIDFLTLDFSSKVNGPTKTQNTNVKFNKLLVRSCFENDGWIDRIAANPMKERRVKMQNEKGNDIQHSKIGFAVEVKKRDPAVSFANFTEPTVASKSMGKRAARSTTQHSPSNAVPQPPVISGEHHELTTQQSQSLIQSQPVVNEKTAADSNTAREQMFSASQDGSPNQRFDNLLQGFPEQPYGI